MSLSTNLMFFKQRSVPDESQVHLQFIVMDSDSLSRDDMLGAVTVTIDQGKEVTDWYNLTISGQIKLRLAFADTVKVRSFHLLLWVFGVGA